VSASRRGAHGRNSAGEGFAPAIEPGPELRRPLERVEVSRQEARAGPDSATRGAGLARRSVQARQAGLVRDARLEHEGCRPGLLDLGQVDVARSRRGRRSRSVVESCGARDTDRLRPFSSNDASAAGEERAPRAARP